MPPIVLINPNSAAATTAMMLRAARLAAPGHAIAGFTATQGPAMILDEAALLASAGEVVRIGLSQAANARAIIVGAFGNPGAEQLRRALAIPVVGIGEAAMLEAAAGGRRFGVATSTAGLADSIAAGAARLGLTALFTGVRLTDGEPLALAADPAGLERALALAVERAVGIDGAQAVAIGGGPFAEAAAALQARLGLPVIAPVPAAVRRVLAELAGGLPPDAVSPT